MTENIILLGRVGSHAYGLNHEDSDEDFLGVFVAPTLEVAGLHWNSHKESIVTSSVGPAENDRTLHEVAKFLRLVLKCNPTVTELLWLDDYIVDTSWEAQWMLSIRESFLSEKYVKAAYRGYASQQLQKFVASEEWKPKHARHCLRLTNQGQSLLETGSLQVRVPDPQVYWDLQEMPPDEVVAVLKKALDLFDETMTTPLPEEVDDSHAQDFLRAVRTKYI